MTQPTRGGSVTEVWQTLCKLCRPLPPPAMGARLPFIGGKPALWTAGWLAMLIKAGYVEINPGSTTTHKQVWICDIYYRQIQVRKQIPIRCNRVEDWVYLRCAGIRLAQYTYTRTCHQHKASRLTTHTDITPPSPLALAPPPPQHRPHPRNQNTHIPLSPCSSRIGKAQTQ